MVYIIKNKSNGVNLIKSFCRGVQGGQFFQKAPPLVAEGKENYKILSIKAQKPVKKLTFFLTLKNFPAGKKGKIQRWQPANLLRLPVLLIFGTKIA